MPIGGHDYGVGDVISRSDFGYDDDKWGRFLGRLYADVNGPYYGGEGSLTSVDLRPGYIVNYLFASGIIDGVILDSIIKNNGGDPNGYYAGIINSNPVTQSAYNWHKAREFIVEQVESGNASQDQQNWYDRWKASGKPTTKDGMWSPEQYDEWSEAPINNIEPGTATSGKIAEALIEAGYAPDRVNEIIYGRWEKNEYGKLVRVPNTGAVENRSGQDAVTLEGILNTETDYNWNILDDLAGEAEGSNDWTVFTVDTDGDGVDDTVYRENNNDGTIQRVYGAEVDENDPQIAGQIADARRNQQIYDDAINSEGWDELEDWEKNAVLRDNGYDDYRDGWFGDGPDDYSEFGLCSDNYTVKADEDGTNCSDYLTEEEKLVRDYGQEAVDKAKEIYNGIKDIFSDKLEEISEIDSLEDVLDYILPELPEECKESTTNKPNDWWKDCVNLSVLGQIPGLPIPLPPGTIDVNTTVRDLEDAAKEAGKTLEDIFNPTCTGTPAEIQECENRTISDIIGDWASDVWEDIKGSFEEAGDFTVEGLLQTLIDNGYNILSGWILTKVEDAATIENPLVFFPLQSCADPEAFEQATPEQQALCTSNVINCEDEGREGGYIDKTRAECGPPIHGYCEDGVTIKDDAKGTNCDEYSEFGFCDDGTKKVDELGTNCEEYAEFGLCADGTKKVDELGTNCEEYAEFGFCEDESTKKVDELGTNCSEYTEPFDCSSVDRKPPESGEDATSANDCGSCIDTSLEPNNAGICEEPGT